MYHDQALIPIKTLAFDDAVNVTLGLPFVRTSPDHGTAFDIAGTGTADPASLIAALALAARLAANAEPRRSRAASMSADRRPAAAARGHRARTACSAKKSLGQNFLLDLNLTARIARAAGAARRRHRRRDRARARRADARAARRRARAGSSPSSATSAPRRRSPEIAARYPGRLEVVEGDALAVDSAPLLGGGPARIVANLPYNIAHGAAGRLADASSRGRPGTIG